MSRQRRKKLGAVDPALQPFLDALAEMIVARLLADFAKRKKKRQRGECK
jgi:hypothetical protein